MNISTFLALMGTALFFAGATEFMLASMLAPLADAFGVSPAEASWLVSGYALAYALAAPPLGWLADRLGRHTLIRLALALFALDGAALPFAPSLSWAIGLRVIGGVAAAALIPSVFALLGDTVPATRRVSAMSHVMLGMTLGIAAGPALAGGITAWLGWRAVFFANAVAFLAMSALAARQPIPGTRPHDASRGEPHVSDTHAPALPLLAKAAWLCSAVTAMLLSGLLLMSRFGLDSAHAGLAVSVFGGGLGLGNALAPAWQRLPVRCPSPHRGAHERIAWQRAIGLSAIALGVLYAAPLPLAGALGCLALLGVATGIGAPLSTALLAARAGTRAGVTLAVSESLNNLGLLACMPLAAHALTASRPTLVAAGLGAAHWFAIGLLLADARLCYRRAAATPRV